MNRVIECECGEWEEFNADDARHKSQTFTHVENTKTEAKYKCSCGKLVISFCE